MRRTIVVGGSAGGLCALRAMLGSLPKHLSTPIVAVLHQRPSSDSAMAEILAATCSLDIKLAEDKEPMATSTVYLAPPGYHLLIENDLSFSLSLDPRVSFARPSIDVLFESAADAIGPLLTGVLLSGANQDGCAGLLRIRRLGGRTIVQSPDTAEAPAMPLAAIQAGAAELVLPLDHIAPQLVRAAFSEVTDDR